MPLGSFEPLPFRHGCAATLSPFHGDSFWLVLPPACPERGFEPSAPSGRCSEGRIGRNREYCKRQRSKTTIFQPAFVAANVMSSREGNNSKRASAARCSPSVCFAIAHRQLPRKRWRLIVCFTSSHIKPALKGEVANVVSRRGYKAAYSSCLSQPLSHGLRRASSP